MYSYVQAFGLQNIIVAASLINLGVSKSVFDFYFKFPGTIMQSICIPPD